MFGKKKLLESEKRFKVIFQHAPIGIAQISLRGRFLKVNKRFCDIFGHKREDFSKLTFRDLSYPEDIDKDMEKVQKVIKEELKIYRGKKRYVHKTGKIIWVSLKVSLVKDSNGNAKYLILIVKNITERIETRRELKKKEKLYRSIAENLPHGIVHILDKDFNYIHSMGEELNRLNLSNKNLRGKNVYEVLDKETAEFVASKYEKSLKKNKVVTFEGEIKDQTFLINAIPIKFNQDSPSQILVLSVNISDRKKMENKLRELNEKLKRSNEELEQFAYVASHDLQEPLRMVSSFTQLLQKRYQDKLDEDANEFIDYAVDGAKRMQKLINDLLLFSRVGTRGNPFKPTDMNKIIEEIKIDLRQLIQETNAKMLMDSLPTIKADKGQMRQLMQNLILNAIKFRKKDKRPKIDISSKENDNHWIFSVKDNGIGIDQEYFEKIFIIFQRLHNKSEYGGTGIGLAVCKKIVKRHGGEIGVKSQKGRGSTFFFSIRKSNISKIKNHIKNKKSYQK
ncbi:MAG: PAS domain-containing sensor histidine kinase [Minisyncoccales bacterium]